LTEEEWVASSQSCCGTQSETSRSCCTSGTAAVHEELAEVLRLFDVNEFAASVRVFAVKP
jgi:hypothetical protein